METNDHLGGARHPATWKGITAKFAVIVLVIVLANIAVSELIERLGIQIWPEYLEIVDRTVLVAVIVYILLMSLPFLPGVEIGLTLMIVLGPKGVAIVYVCTLFALLISFSVGRLIPPKLLVSLLQWLHLARAASLFSSYSEVPPENRLEYLIQRVSVKVVPSVLKHRYLTLALLLNLPGNALVGGGGGIGMMAGMSRLYSYPVYFLVVAVSILPVPLFFILSKSI
jgi:hypothetical protein